MGGFKISDFALECLTPKGPVFFSSPQTLSRPMVFIFQKKTGDVFDWVVKGF